MSTNQTKVYCGQCRWWLIQFTVNEVCEHVTNIQWIDTYKERTKGPAWKPCDKNNHNDCPLFEPIPRGPEVIETLSRPRGHGHMSGGIRVKVGGGLIVHDGQTCQ